MTPLSHRRPRKGRPHVPGRARRRSREGVVLLVVMLLLTMLTATATFAFSNTSIDQRAAGAYRMAVTAQYTADSAALAAAALAQDRKDEIELFGSAANWSGGVGATIRQQLGLPDPVVAVSDPFAPRLLEGETAYEGNTFVVADLGASQMDALVPQFDAASPRAAPFGTPYQRRIYSPVDVWPIRGPSESSWVSEIIGYRLVITGVGDIAPRAVDVAAATAGNRTKHQTISMTRAYVDQITR